jgi:hypothetical protein
LAVNASGQELYAADAFFLERMFTSEENRVSKQVTSTYFLVISAIDVLMLDA